LIGPVSGGEPSMFSAEDAQSVATAYKREKLRGGKKKKTKIA
jgi:hypothetical protein